MTDPASIQMLGRRFEGAGAQVDVAVNNAALLVDDDQDLLARRPTTCAGRSRRISSPMDGFFSDG